MSNEISTTTIRINARRGAAECTACHATRLGACAVLEQWRRDHVCQPVRPVVREMPEALDGDWRAGWH